MMKNGISIMIPSSLTIESPDQRIKTYKVGQIARAASIFGVSEILIYRDPKLDDSKFIELVLRYVETPQYLRKRLFPLKDELKYVGTIPPLRTPHHPLKLKPSDLKVGMFREGVVVNRTNEGVRVDIGMDNLADLHTYDKLRSGDRLTLKVVSTDPLEVEVSDKGDIPSYWGYETKITGRLGTTITRFKDEKIVLTSRLGEIASVDKIREIASERVLFVFGPPHKGVEELLGDENISTDDLSCTVLNTIPNQNTATVRTEEAIFATLSVYNSLRI